MRTALRTAKSPCRMRNRRAACAIAMRGGHAQPPCVPAQCETCTRGPFDSVAALALGRIQEQMAFRQQHPSNSRGSRSASPSAVPLSAPLPPRRLALTRGTCLALLTSCGTPAESPTA
jgi:hypothetical protein